MLAKLKAFGEFWYDFVIGDDWRIAAVVVVALFATWAVSTTTVPAWWVIPGAFAILLPLSLWRAVTGKH